MRISKLFHKKSTSLYYFRERLNQMDKSEEYQEVLDVLIQNAMFGFEGLSIGELSSITGKSEYIIRKNIKLIEKDNLVKKMKTRPYLYTADLDMLDAITD